MFGAARTMQTCLMGNKKAFGLLLNSLVHQGGAAKETLADLLSGGEAFLEF